MKETKYCMIESAFDNEEELNKVIDVLLENELVCSCQVVESKSRWIWHKEIEASKEYLLFMKTKKSLADKVFETIQNIHNYECFEFAIFDLTSSNQDYLKWIEEETTN